MTLYERKRYTKNKYRNKPYGKSQSNQNEDGSCQSFSNGANVGQFLKSDKRKKEQDNKNDRGTNEEYIAPQRA